MLPVPNLKPMAMLSQLFHRFASRAKLPALPFVVLPLLCVKVAAPMPV